MSASDLIAIGAVLMAAGGIVVQLKFLTAQVGSLERRLEKLELYLLENHAPRP